MSSLARCEMATKMSGPKARRKQQPAGEVRCTSCAAKCCRYFALPIDTPTTWQDFDSIRWFLLHDRATVFREDGTWYLMVSTACRHLGADNRCAAYEVRPQICRGYSTDDCEGGDDWVYDRYLETPEQVEEYAEAVLGPRQRRRVRRPR